MSSLDRCRRAATVLLVATFLVLVPQLATATFTATQDVSQSVGTATMGTPTGVIGTWQCWATGNGNGNNGNDNGNGNNGNGNGNGNAYAYGHGYNHGNDHDEGWEAVQVSVVSFSDAEPTGVTYRYSLERLAGERLARRQRAHHLDAHDPVVVRQLDRAGVHALDQLPPEQGRLGLALIPPVRSGSGCVQRPLGILDGQRRGRTVMKPITIASVCLATVASAGAVATAVTAEGAPAHPSSAGVQAAHFAH